MLMRVLDALEQQVDAPSFEVIVINDGSTDPTEKSRRCTRRYRFSSGRRRTPGPGRARNHGVSLAQGKFVVFIGDDTVPESDFLAEHARVHREAADDPLMACLGYTGWPHSERVTAFMDYINDYGLQFGYKLIRGRRDRPVQLLLHLEHLHRSRAPRPRILSTRRFPAAAWEDIELAYRLDALGLKIRYNAAAVTRHYHPMTVDSFARRQYTVGKSGRDLLSQAPGARPLPRRARAGDAAARRTSRACRRLAGARAWARRFRPSASNASSRR